VIDYAVHDARICRGCCNCETSLNGFSRSRTHPLLPRRIRTSC
jgi:hypothetical protein